MNILLVYGTNSSGTALVAETVASRLTAAGHRVTVKHARDASTDDLRQPVDCIVLGSCTWERFTPEGKRLEGQLQQHMYALLESADVNPRQRFALFALGDSSYTDFCAAADHLEDAVQRWMGHLVIPTLRVDSYFFDLPRNRERVNAWSDELINKLV